MICDEMWCSVDIYGPQSEIDRFKREFIVPATAFNIHRSTLMLELRSLGGFETWNFRDPGPHERGIYSFAFDALAIFPTTSFEDLVDLFPTLFFDCDCIADDDSSMGYGWFNVPPGGQPFRDQYDVPKGYWTHGIAKRAPLEAQQHSEVIAALRQRLRDEDVPF